MLDLPGDGLYRIEPTMPEDIADVASRMRQADIDEVEASHGTTPLWALNMSVHHSEEPWTIWAGGERVALFGVVPTSLVMGVGLVWLLGTDAIAELYRPFLRFSRPVIEELSRGYRMIYNDVDNRNLVSARWLKWCGFKATKLVHRGPDRLPFTRFVKRREGLCV